MGWKRDGQPAVAQGLKIEKIADGFLHPRMVYVLPNDDILVVESNGPGEEPLTTPKQLIAGIVKNQSGKGGKGGNRITLLRKNASGWEKHIFLEHLHSPFGVQLIGDDLYVANTGNIMRYHYQPGRHISAMRGASWLTCPAPSITTGPKRYWQARMVRSCMWASARTVISLRMDWILNIVAPRFWRLIRQPAQTVSSPAVSGILPDSVGNRRRASFGLLPMSAMKSAPTVPDYLTSVQDGGFYGWPWSYFGQHVDRRVQPPRPDMVAKAIKPDYALSSHVAPLGMLFYTGKMLSQTYQGGVFISEHGSWDRSPLNGYKVSFVAFKDGKPVGKPQSVITGFVSRDEKELYGAPVGLAQDNEGALIIADDVGNTVWRVSAK